MKRTFLATAGTIAVLSLAATGNALAAGNDATGSIGAVQVGPTATAPTVGTTTPANGSLAAAAPVGVTGTGGNTVSNGIGSAQAGGGNSAGDSAGAIQATGVHVAPAASVGNGSTSAQAGTTAASGGDNKADGSIGTAQVGGTKADTKVATTSAAGNQGATVPVSLGGSGSGSNTAGNSIGAVQVGGGSNEATTPPSGSTPPSGTTPTSTPPVATEPAAPPAGGTSTMPPPAAGIVPPVAVPTMPGLNTAEPAAQAPRLTSPAGAVAGAGGVAATSATRAAPGVTEPQNRSQKPKHSGRNPCLTASSMGFDAPAGPGTPLPLLGAGLLFLFGLVRMSLVGRKPLAGLR